MKSKFDDLKNLTPKELLAQLKDNEKKLMEMNFQRKTSHVEKPHLFKLTRKNIARIKTILKSKEQGNV